MKTGGNRNVGNFEDKSNELILGKQKAMGVIEVVLIILVLVGLALVFKSQISGIADGVYTTIKTQIKKF